MSEKFNGNLKVKGVDMFHLLPASHGEKKKKEKRKQKRKHTKKPTSRKLVSKKGTSIDVIA